VRIAIDWTGWRSDLKIRVVSVLVGRRAISVPVSVFPKMPMLRPQNGWENTFLRLWLPTLGEVGQ